MTIDCFTKKSMWANLNDGVLNLVHHETKDNWLGEWIQPSATYTGNPLQGSADPKNLNV